MTKAIARAIGYAIWAASLVPVALLALWLGFQDWTWRGFLTAYFVIGFIGLTADLLTTWIEGLLQRRRERRGAAPEQ